MVDQKITTFFNKIYEDTYKSTLLYVTGKCGNTEDIADILQEIYTEVYSVLVKKGIDYARNTEAFIFMIAKVKVYRHYTFSEKLKNLIPMFSKNEDDEDVNIVDINMADFTLEDNIINKMLFEQIAIYISSKSDLVKKIFYLYYYNELTIPEIAKQLSINESNIKNKLYRTVKEIRHLYGKDGTLK